MSLPPLYGFDLLTDTTDAFIDSTLHQVVRVGISTPAGDEVYEGEEAEVLQLVDHRLAVLPPGVIVTWQGSLLDLPLFRARASAHGMTPGLRLRPDHRPAPATVLRDIDHPWCADWHGHQHLELRRVYDDPGRWWSPTRQRLDPESMIPPSNALARRDPRKDARLARTLAERRWNQAKRHVDRMPEPTEWVPPSIVTPAVNAEDRSTGS